MPESTTAKTRTVTLTDRPPVRIAEADWPIVAEASGDSYVGHRGDGRYHQALTDGALDRYKLVVRQHQDGRALVYAVLNAATFATNPHRDWRGGYVVPVGADVARAVISAGESGGFPDHVIRECIANLPAEEL